MSKNYQGMGKKLIKVVGAFVAIGIVAASAVVVSGTAVGGGSTEAEDAMKNV